MPQLRPDGTPYPYDVRQAQLRKDRGFFGKHGLFKNAVLPTVGFAAAPFAVGALTGGAGAAGSAATGAKGAVAGMLGTGGSTAGSTAAGAGMTLGKLWDLGNLGVGAVTSILGQRSQNRALNSQMAMQQREIDARLAADAEARAEAKRQFDATQANLQRQYAADDEERAFNRAQREHERRILDEREARAAGRRAYSDRARQRLSQFLGLG